MTYTNAVVPDRNIILTPLETTHVLARGRDDLIQIRNDVVAFKFWDSRDFGHEAGIVKKELPPGDRVGPNEWLLCDDRITPNGPLHLIVALSL